ncbi:NYN domain-containing protein [Dyadobacter sp. MSC1_007]|jgi:uncharacterized LabA/DUF88 family protein|uniref:NYN domain-containing protein n=1 Tax=Dyadobacter sp. MSC1_007 TaxID=2909264 RepID=UPI0020306C77|nr:NYN domain-containing protein [Dyadobacter sp. MSC1_007]
MAETKFNIAVLIDGDNAQAKLIKEIFEEVSKYGKATIRRIYGDWTRSDMNSWKEIVNKYSINPIQKFSYTSGKNSTDSALIIEAMDILHTKSIDGFCIVSSDSDYTGLAKRIREEGLFVMGIGRKTTPIAFVSSCEIFTFSENLVAELEVIPEEQTPLETSSTTREETPKSPKEPRGKQFPDIDMRVIDKAFEISTNEEDQAFISTIGSSLRKIDPSFDSRTYGFKKLTQLFKSIDKYEIVGNEVDGVKHLLVRLRK